MSVNGWLQILVFCGIVVALVKPLGWYMTRVFAGERTLLSPLLRPVEVGLYRVAGVDANREQHWLTYAVAMLLFNAAGFVILYLLQRMQGMLPFNPAAMAARSGRSRLQHGDELRDEHELAELRRRGHDELSRADGRPDRAEFPVRRDRHRPRRRPDPWVLPRLRPHRRQLLARHDPLHALRPAAALHRADAVLRLARRSADARRLMPT